MCLIVNFLGDKLVKGRIVALTHIVIGKPGLVALTHIVVGKPGSAVASTVRIYVNSS